MLAIKPLAACFAAVTSALAPNAGAFGVPMIPSPGSVDSQPTKDQFHDLSAKANNAAMAGDWDTALEAARQALDASPEAADTHRGRAELIGLVGHYEIEHRTDDQVRVSAGIIRHYLDELEAKRGEDAKSLRAWEDATADLARLEERVPPRPKSGTVPLLEPDTPASWSTADRKLEHERTPPGRGMQIAGGVSTGIGAVLLVSGLVYVGMWGREEVDYRRLKEKNSVEGSVTPEEEEEADRARRRPRGPALGLTIPAAVLLGVGIALVVVGTRRVKSSDRVAFGPAGIEVRF